MATRNSILVYSYLTLVGLAGCAFAVSDIYHNAQPGQASVRAYENVLAYSTEHRKPAVAISCYTAPNEQGMVECSYTTLDAKTVKINCLDRGFNLPFAPIPCQEKVEEPDNPYLR